MVVSPGVRRRWRGPQRFATERPETWGSARCVVERGKCDFGGTQKYKISVPLRLISLSDIKVERSLDMF